MRVTGATTESVNRFVLDSAAVYIDYELPGERTLGATQEGATFTLEQTNRQTPIDGFRGPVKGARRVTEETARITASILEMTSENMARILTGSTVTDHTADGASNPTHNQVQRMSDLPNTGDYATNVALVGRVQGSGQPMVVILFNALSDGELELETTDQEEGTIEVQFTAHFDLNDPDTAPYALRFPKDVDAVAT